MLAYRCNRPLDVRLTEGSALSFSFVVVVRAKPVGEDVFQDYSRAFAATQPQRLVGRQVGVAETLQRRYGRNQRRHVLEPVRRRAARAHPNSQGFRRSTGRRAKSCVLRVTSVRL